MEPFRTYYPGIATAVFVGVILVAHLAVTDNYKWTHNTISDLGAQGYPRKVIMQTGFVAFGLLLAMGTLMNGLSWRSAPLLVYGLCVFMTGIFCTTPFTDVVTFSKKEAFLHSLFAQMAGFAFSIGILVQIFYSADIKTKCLHLAFLVLVLGLSAAFGLFKENQGITQRLLYGVSFAWLMVYYKPCESKGMIHG